MTTVLTNLVEIILYGFYYGNHGFSITTHNHHYTVYTWGSTICCIVFTHAKILISVNLHWIIFHVHAQTIDLSHQSPKYMSYVVAVTKLITQ